MTVDLCIVNYHTDDMIVDLLECTSWGLDHPVYIQNNDGTHSDKLEFMQAHKKMVTVIDSDNVGYARACNNLASQGDSEIIGLLNGDVWFTAKAVDEVEQFFEDNPDVSIMGPKQMDSKGYITAGGIFGTHTAPKHRGWKVHDPDDKLYKDVREAVTIAGSAYFIRRSVWEYLTGCGVYQGLGVFSNSDVQGAFLPTPHYY